ncbi:PD-(D/E)XK nuclease family transposase [Bacillus thuringiensis]|uniref:PD-(D/E)XK nuclease family transposase n=1 Tax=Bacillus thuringiensis TaxID=1428 RepID=UPI003D6CC049
MEIEVCDEDDFVKGSLYYWSGLYACEMEKGGCYDGVRKSITINILNFAVLRE